MKAKGRHPMARTWMRLTLLAAALPLAAACKTTSPSDLDSTSDGGGGGSSPTVVASVGRSCLIARATSAR